MIKSFWETPLRFFGMGAKKTKEEEEGSATSFAKEYIGVVCKVLDYENKQCFSGKIEEYDPEYNELKIVPYRMDYISVSVPYNTPIKLQIQKGEQLTLLYGIARKQSKECWWVTLDDVIRCEEQREGFRQPLKGQIMVTRPIGGKKFSCDLVDISLTGICIKTKEDMEVGEHIMLHDVVLDADAVEKRSFICEVRRVFGRGPNNEVINIAPAPNPTPEPEDPNKVQIVIESLDGEGSPQRPLVFEEKYYGCSFLDLSPEEKDEMYKELFAIQQRERNMY